MDRPTLRVTRCGRYLTLNALVQEDAPAGTSSHETSVRTQNVPARRRTNAEYCVAGLTMRTAPYECQCPRTYLSTCTLTTTRAGVAPVSAKSAEASPALVPSRTEPATL